MCVIVQAQSEIIDHKMQDVDAARNDLTEVNSNMNSLLTSCDEVSFINLVSSLEMDINKQVGVAKEAMQELGYQTLQFKTFDFTSEFTQQLSTWSVTTKQKVRISPFQLIYNHTAVRILHVLLFHPHFTYFVITRELREFHLRLALIHIFFSFHCLFPFSHLVYKLCTTKAKKRKRSNQETEVREGKGKGKEFLSVRYIECRFCFLQYSTFDGDDGLCFYV
jgi:hypothetical protein